MIRIVRERPEHAAAIERLLDEGFGRNRKGRPSYRFRRRVAPLSELCLVALDGAALVGVIRFWPVRIGARTPAVLLGPIAVAGSHRGRGIGSRLVRRGLAACRAAGHRISVAIGTRAYLGRFGFAPARAQGLILKARVDDERFLVRALNPGALDGAAGEVRALAPASPPRAGGARSRRGRSGARGAAARPPESPAPPQRSPRDRG